MHFSHRFAEPGTILFDSSKQDTLDQRSLLFTEPVAELSTHRSDDLFDLLEAVDDALASGYYVAGWIDYEAGYAFERWPSYQKTGLPLAWFGLYDRCYRVPPRDIEPVFAAPTPKRSDFLYAPTFSMTQPAYTDRIQRIKDYIRQGDAYQINFTGALTFNYVGTPLDLYRLLRSRQSVSYGAYIQHAEGAILSFSPELFFHRDGNSITTRPMKGTISRGRNAREDQDLSAWLLSDEKNRAENVMIVDLLRNDLSRICQPGSVHVPSLYALETYETLFQMTSTVTGTLRDDITSPALFEALFPGGSITGAPKLRAMEIIKELEEQPRGVYCGAIGFMAPQGLSVFNIAIRTIVLEEGKGTMGTGSGIVWDSSPSSEYEECLLKGKFLRIDDYDDSLPHLDAGTL